MQSCLELIPDDIERIFVAYSGGLDSSVLLHLALDAGLRDKVIAWHINHGLIEAATQMEQFCREQARFFGVEIRVDRLHLGDVERNLEAVARRQRYRLLQQKTRAGDCILTAHHADDQAETFLLNALRGSGSAGLRGIAPRRSLGDALLLRPLLRTSRADLEEYAARHELAWFNDPSNRSNRFDRNYLRNGVMPRLRQRWPKLQVTIGTACELQSEIQDLLDEIGELDLAVTRAEPSAGLDTLALDGLLELSPQRQKNLLRYWIRCAGFVPLPQRRLRELMRQLDARPDSMPRIEMPDYSIRLYDRRLFLVVARGGDETGGAFEFGLQSDIEIEAYDFRTSRAAIFSRLRIKDSGQSLTLRYRGAGDGARNRHRLKRLFQKHRVPPWERARTPQVYLDGRLEEILP